MKDYPMTDSCFTLWTPPRAKPFVSDLPYRSEETFDRRCSSSFSAKSVACESRSPLVNTFSPEFHQAMEEAWGDVFIPILDDAEPGFSTPTKSFSKRAHRRRMSVLRCSRPPWESLNHTQERDDFNNENNMAGPPPPPSPSRRSCFVSLENFAPTPTLGEHFPHGDPDCQDDEDGLKSSKRIYMDSFLDEGPMLKRPKLAMKRTQYREFELFSASSTLDKVIA